MRQIGEAAVRQASKFNVFALPIGGGALGSSRMPGESGDYTADFRALLRWRPTLVVTLSTATELDDVEASLGADLRHAPPAWVHLPIADKGIPDASATRDWVGLEVRVLGRLAAGERILFHCKTSGGRSGMAMLRIMIAAGEAPDTALARLRAIRPTAIETPAQLAWATR